jgi:hypothetical protein
VPVDQRRFRDRLRQHRDLHFDRHDERFFLGGRGMLRST